MIWNFFSSFTLSSPDELGVLVKLDKLVRDDSLEVRLVRDDSLDVRLELVPELVDSLTLDPDTVRSLVLLLDPEPLRSLALPVVTLDALVMLVPVWLERIECERLLLDLGLRGGLPPEPFS